MLDNLNGKSITDSSILDGLNLKQAKLLLTTKGLSNEKQKELLLDAGLIASCIETGGRFYCLDILEHFYYTITEVINMPRTPRQKSESGIYHIMLRGINQQVIFEDEEDYLRLVATLQKYKEICGYKIFAYCLMSNHIHILLKIEKEDLELILKRIAGSYVYWYNWKYYRKGHLFQDRFKSEPVENDEYFLTVLRYIHQNPIKSNITNILSEYVYSSYNDYLKGKSDLVDIEFALSMMSKKEFIEFNNEINNDNCLDIDKQAFRLSDKDAKIIIEKISNCRTTSEFQLLDVNMRNKYIREFKKKGLSIRQISRLTGVSKGIIERT